MNQPVLIAAGGGSIQPVVANSVDFVGVFAGCEFIPLGGRPTESDYWPAGTVLDTAQGPGQYGGYNMIAYYYDDPAIVYEIQTDGGTLYTSTIIGGQINLTNFGNGSTVTGLSQCTAGGAQIASASQGQLRVVDAGPEADNVIGDQTLNLYVQIARHQYLANKVAP
jgi:hypothetical protein